jgi:hypothetical protein
MWNENMPNYPLGPLASGYLATDGENAQESNKISHDSYKVFVNSDYVGDKVLLAQNEHIEGLEKYLKNKGFENFSTKLTGNEYVINPAASDSHDMKNILEVYLRTR